MPRIRTIKPEFFRHHDLYRAEIDTKLPLRVAFAGLWTAADREGRFRWDPYSLKLDCLPYDKVDFSRVLHALMTRGFIERYQAHGQQYGWIPSWIRHQVINNREKASNLPNPLDAAVSTREPRVSETHVHAQGEGEGEGEGEKEGITPPTPLGGNGALAESFAIFWNHYPRHDGSKLKAWQLFCRIAPDSDLLESWWRWLEQARASEQWSEASKIPHATTWLNQRRWEGDPPPSRKQSDFLKTLDE